MTFIFDHIIATIVVATLFFSLAVTQLRVQEAGIAQVSSHAAKKKALTFGQWLDADIVSLGENVADNSARFGNPDSSTFIIYALDEDNDPQPETVAYTTEWEFYSNDDGGLQQFATRYSLLLQPDSLEIELTKDFSYRHPLFQLRRDTTDWKPVDPNTGQATFSSADFTEDGRSVSTLSLFRIQLLDNQGTPFAADDPDAPDEASYIRVDFSLVPEFDLDRNYLHELYWTTTLKVRPFWN